ncbi:ubiquitin carboxyl-terminal hydrolase 17-like protein A isoform X2 [Acanthopagrus latus]|uniref:ubiquitin carboxyl-terminal hydrolase 17-like protein A isoform X2 n=1 Tax=Acanthopagrus latus TaxID=8177 RepID=UPI00187CB1ED|nr:ubiquitin carboxyl-terminal hydrolase 17-like protein A isoform X2 [Acanthopagrus latus]
MEENNEMEEEETPAEARKTPDETEAGEKKPTGAEERVTQTQKRHHDPNDQHAAHSTSVQAHTETPDRKLYLRVRTVDQEASGHVGEQLTDSCEQRLDEETKTETLEHRVAPQTRHHGLSNQGATCYLNSVLQVLSMTTEIHHRLDPQKHTDLQLRNIFTGLKKRTCGTENITATFGIKNVYEPSDAAECLERILHQVSTDASEVFRGKLTETTTCSDGHVVNEETNPFWTLPLSLRHAADAAYSLESSFNRIFQDVTYSGDNKVYCDECDQDSDATARCEMVEAPQILILLLKRFDLDRNTRSHFKSHCCVKVPGELQLKEKTYTLYGRVDHMGSIRGGHYTATVRSGDTWYHCNDSHVQIRQQLFAEDGTFSSRSVYLLMYRASESKVSSKTRQNEENEPQTRNDSELLKRQPEGEEDDTERNLDDKFEGLKSVKASKQHVDGETETEERGAPKKLGEKTSPGQTDDAAERQDETSDEDDQMQTDGDVAAESQVFPDASRLDDLTQDDVEPKRRSLERDAEDEDQEQIRQNDTCELQETRDEALSRQTGGRDADAGTGKVVLEDEFRSEPEQEPVNREKLRDDEDDEAGERERFGSHDNSVDVEAQNHLNINPDRTHSCITQGNTSNKAEEGQKNEGDDASVNGEEQSKNLDEGDIISDDGEGFFSCICGNNAEDDGVMRREEERLQAGRGGCCRKVRLTL